MSSGGGEPLKIDPERFRMPALLYRYWTTGAGGRAIRWGTDGDLTRCARLISRKMRIPQSRAFPVCQNLHIRFLGRPNPRD